MSENILVFERVEQKYFLSHEQADRFCEMVKDHLADDIYPQYTLQNLYLDSRDDILAIRSLEQPLYKEKLRIRTYGHPENGDPVFLEMKKQNAGIVFKRRITIGYEQINDWLKGKVALADQYGQMGAEFDYLRRMYHPQPKIYITYSRRAWYEKDDPDNRITFDRNIRYRNSFMALTGSPDDLSLITPGPVLLEVKIHDAYPIWLAHALAELKVRQTKFSKYGSTYSILHDRRMLRPQCKKEEEPCFNQYLQTPLQGLPYHQF